MRSRLNLNGAEEEANIDMTPMLDVVFIMLIFFIVSTTFVRDEGVEINRPTATSGSEARSQGVIIAIDSQGQIWFDRAQLTLDELNNALLLQLAEKSDLSVLIKADLQTPTGDLITVLDKVKALGVVQVAVATQAP
ncbi:MAG: biopolymer transporter ExbD [Oceanospirillaceae bacterium]|nr:biopolymer transporter ExbD [Oceanospirillaceae bacterium]